MGVQNAANTSTCFWMLFFSRSIQVLLTNIAYSLDTSPINKSMFGGESMRFQTPHEYEPLAHCRLESQLCSSKFFNLHLWLY